ncbi:MAG: DsbA family oxidoreductase [Nitrospiraceae bacterium]
MNGQDAVLHIKIYSDVVCPWCYVGKRRLERALSELKDMAHAQITWRPFQLNPTMAKEGMDRTSYLQAKFGSLDAFRQMEEHLLAAGAAEHIPFAFEKVARTPNTLMAHRLIWYAGQRGRQDATVESLFRGYFTEGADIGSVPVLGQLADRAGLDPAAVESLLDSEEGVTNVKAEEAAGHRLGIRGVPYFVLNDSLSISGAQPPDIFLSAFQQAKETVTERKEGA